MTAAAQGRNTLRRDGTEYSIPVAASTTLYAGTVVVLDSSGNAIAGKTATGLVVVGIAQATADNSAGSAGDVNVLVRRGVFALANSASTDAIAAKDFGASAYLVDNQTVAKTSGSDARSVAGTIRGLADNGDVWVEI